MIRVSSKSTASKQPASSPLPGRRLSEVKREANEIVPNDSLSEGLSLKRFYPSKSFFLVLNK